MLPADTSRDAFRAQVDAYRRIGSAARARLAVQMSEEARELTRSGIRARHPSYDAEQVECALRRLLLGDELYRSAWPDGPVLDP